MASGDHGVDLYWLPIGAGGTGFVRLNGRLYEAVSAWREHRHACDLYHSGLEVRLPEGRWVIEQTPAGSDASDRGVVGVGPIGSDWLAAHFAAFRYELRRWRDGVIPDVAEAVASPLRLTDDARVAQRLLDLVAEVPMLVWGRDQLAAGEMWNSNSQVAWLLARSGLDAAGVRLPPNGRAPGWRAGLVAAGMGRLPVTAAGRSGPRRTPAHRPR